MSKKSAVSLSNMLMDVLSELQKTEDIVRKQDAMLIMQYEVNDLTDNQLLKLSQEQKDYVMAMRDNSILRFNKWTVVRRNNKYNFYRPNHKTMVRSRKEIETQWRQQKIG